MTAVAQETSPTTVPPSTTSTAPGTLPSRENEAIERALIDSSTRGPVLTFFATALGWLLLSSLLGLISSIKLHSPGFLADLPITVAVAYECPVGVGAVLRSFERVLCIQAHKPSCTPPSGGAATSLP